jgi:predicted RNase H-like HicB family nuclease
LQKPLAGFEDKKMTHYVGIVDGSGSVWGVRFPDLPGCVGGGPTPETAISDAALALKDVMAHKQSSGLALPPASALADIIASGEIGEGESAVMIPLLLDSGRTVRANLTLDAGLLETIDSEAKSRGITRSAFVASAAREKIASRS